MGLDRLTQSATAIAEENSSGVENMQAGRPQLRLVQEGLANKPDTGLEGKEAQRFHVEGVDRVRGLTVIRGKVNGQPRAIVTHTPLELLLPAEPGRPDTAFERLRNSVLGRVAAVLALVAAGGAILAGCNPDDKPKISSSHAALSAADVDNLVAPALANWTEFGDANNGFQISDIDGRTVIIFGRGGDLYSVSCDELEDCLTSGEAVAVEGLPAGTYASGATDQTEGGVNKLIYQIGTTIRQRNVSYDATSGVLTITGLSEGFSPSMSGNMTYMKISGVPHILRAGGGEVYLRNLNTSEDTLLDLDDGPMAICGTPHQADGGIALGSFLYDTGGGLEYCRLVSAPTLNELLDNFIEGSFPSDDGISRTSPRSINNVLIYVQEDPGGTRIYYAIAPIVPPADAGADGDAGGGTPADNDGGDGPGTGTDGPPPTDGPTDDPDSGEGEGEDGGTTDGPTTPREDAGDKPKEDAGDKPKPPDSGEGEAEGENPLTCDLGAGGAKVTVVEQNCTFSDCGDSDGNGNNDGDVRINGSCTVEIDLGEFGNGTPVTLTVDGEYTVNVLEQIAGQLISGLFQADTGGNDFRSAYGAYVTGPEGTIYGGEGATRMPSTDPSDINMSQHPQYRVFVAEGRVTVFFNGEEVMTLNAGDEHTFPQGGPSETDDTNPKPGCQCASPGSSDNNNPLNSSLGLSLFALAAALKLRPGRSRKRK